MPKYKSEGFDPPAPVAHVKLKNIETGTILPNVPMLIDTGADITVLPASALEKLGVETDRDASHKVQGFDGEIKEIKLARLSLSFLNKEFTGDFLVSNIPTGILGRNILNNIRLLLDGPSERWDEQ